MVGVGMVLKLVHGKTAKVFGTMYGMIITRRGVLIV